MIPSKCKSCPIAMRETWTEAKARRCEADGCAQTMVRAPEWKRRMIEAQHEQQTEANGMAAEKRICKHCKNMRTIIGRGLCFTCFKKHRNEYPKLKGGPKAAADTDGKSDGWVVKPAGDVQPGGNIAKPKQKRRGRAPIAPDSGNSRSVAERLLNEAAGLQRIETALEGIDRSIADRVLDGMALEGEDRMAKIRTLRAHSQGLRRVRELLQDLEGPAADMIVMRIAQAAALE